MNNATPTWLFLDGASDFGGHEVMLLRWLQELQQPNAPVHPVLLARAGSRLLAQAPAGLACKPLVAGSGPASDACQLRARVQALRPECVVVASGAIGAQMAQVLALRLLGQRVLLYVPLLGTFASMGYRAGRWKDRFVRWFYARVPSGWVAITAEQAAQFRAWAQPRGPVFVLPNTVAPAIEQAPRLPVRALADAEPLRVLVLGRLDAHQKGLDLLLAQLSALAQTQPEALEGLQITLVGDGPYRATIDAALAAQPALARHLQCLAWMAPQAALAEADVLLLPSRFEGVPLVMLEAMALGVPVVCSDLPGTRPYVAQGCRFAVGDVAAALAAVRQLRPAARRQALADAGHARFVAQASGRAFAQHVQALTRAVRTHFALDRPPPAPALAQQPTEN